MRKFIFIIYICCSFAFVNAQTAQEQEIALEYFYQKEYDKALPFYQKFYRFNPENNTFYTHLLACYMGLEDYKEAEKVIKSQIKLVNNQKAFIDLGVLYRTMGDDKKAQKTFDEAIKNLQAYPDKVRELATAFQMVQETDRAIAVYQKGLKTVGNESFFHFRLAELYVIKQDYDKMMNELMSVIESNPNEVYAVQTTISTLLDDDEDSPINRTIRTSLLQKAQKSPSQTIYSELLLWIFVQQKNFNAAFTQAKALDKRLKEDGSQVLQLARVCVDNKEYETAIQAYEYIIENHKNSRNYLMARMEILKTYKQKMTDQYQISKEELKSLEKNYLATIQEFSSFQEIADLQIELAELQAFYLHDVHSSIEVLREIIDKNKGRAQTPARAKLMLADILLLDGDIWEPSLLYGQVEKQYKNDVLGEEAKFKNARLSFYKGDFDWANAQMKVLKASTTKLIANDALALSLLIIDNAGLDSNYDALEIYARADLAFYQFQYEKALTILDTLEMFYKSHSLMDEVYFKKAAIQIKKQDYNAALQLYQKIIKEHPTDILADDALYQTAEIYQFILKDNAKAMEAYEKIILEYKSSLFVPEARKRYRQLRGDKVVQ